MGNGVDHLDFEGHGKRSESYSWLLERMLLESFKKGGDVTYLHLKRASQRPRHKKILASSTEIDRCGRNCPGTSVGGNNWYNLGKRGYKLA